ncbi:MAG TPA: hypothetical protein DCS82_09940 [Rhodospirillaceae bacterium]|nr:hypothetical protein [Rhodospirillaceae bacterium]HAA93094.1 hypothetical protein [Rhodospirillaceae bacterium]HAT36026.1 hypothetical protein [Rhodospirillaceae bacterium]|tara:strand:+ start:982 stop:1215 length:234 start_codon:yes stop_codon:yes gene_type:complete
MASDPQPDVIEGRKRLRQFIWHLALYGAAMAVLVPVNILTGPENPWFLLPMVGWGGILALHVAYVMGLFEIFKKDSR